MRSIFNAMIFAAILFGTLSRPANAGCEKATYLVQAHEVLSKIVLDQKHKMHLTAHLYGSTGLLKQTLQENPELQNNGDLIRPGNSITFPMILSVPAGEMDGCTNPAPMAKAPTEENSALRIPAAQETLAPPEPFPSDTPSMTPEIISTPAATPQASPSFEPGLLPEPSPSASPVPVKAPERKTSKADVDVGLGMMLADSAANLNIRF